MDENQAKKGAINKLLLLAVVILLCVVGGLGYLYTQSLSMKKDLEEALSNNETTTLTLTKTTGELDKLKESFSTQSEQLAKLKQDNTELSKGNLVKENTITILKEMNITLLKRIKTESTLQRLPDNSSARGPLLLQIKESGNKLKTLNEKLNRVEIDTMAQIEENPSLIPSFSPNDVVPSVDNVDGNINASVDETLTDTGISMEDTGEDTTDTTTGATTDVIDASLGDTDITPSSGTSDGGIDLNNLDI